MELDHVHELILLPYDNCVPLVFPFFPLQYWTLPCLSGTSILDTTPPTPSPHAHPQLNNHTQIQWCYIHVFHTELTNRVLEGKIY